MSESASNKAIGAKTGVKKIKRQPKPTTKLFQWLYDYDFLYAPILSALVILVVALVKITSFVNLSLGIGIADDTSVFQSSLVASVGVCGPIFLELFQDLSFVIVGRLKKTRALHVGKMRYFIGRIILLAALLIPSCFLLLQVQLGSPYADREVLVSMLMYSFFHSFLPFSSYNHMKFSFLSGSFPPFVLSAAILVYLCYICSTCCYHVCSIILYDSSSR